MVFHTQSTIFGQLMRLLSRGKLFRYPDEVDPSLWKRAVRQDRPDTRKRSDNNNDPAHGSDKEVLDDSPCKQATTDNGIGQDALLVDWYGEDDPEVEYSPASPPAPFSSIRPRRYC